MLQKIKFFFIITNFIVLSGCQSSRAHSIKNPPTKSFVKIIHTININSCVDPKDKMCPIGQRVSAGSGMSIHVMRNIATVITAGHVCDVGPTKKIKEFVQTVEVIDYDSNVHQAYPILVSHNNHKGKPDACLLYVPTLTIPQVKISVTPPKIGQELYYIGAPLGIYNPPNPLMFKGIFSGNMDPSTGQITAPAIGGSSGSAVLDYNNKVMGVIWGANIHFHNSSVMTSYKSFKDFIQKARNKLKYLSEKN